MKMIKFSRFIYFFLMALFLVGCCRSSEDVWDDTKTAGRHMGRGFRSLGGKHGDSRQVCCREDFLQCSDYDCDYSAMEFEPLPDQEVAMANVKFKQRSTPQATKEPGHPRSKIPGIEAFKDPKGNAELKGVFVNVQFPYDSSLVKGKENMDTVRAIAGYLKKHPETYIFVEGHCDERGAEAYNLALGSRRSNSVRNMLVQEGVSPDKIFNVSYGKERPLVVEHNEKAWAKNRRAEFKIHQR